MTPGLHFRWSPAVPVLLLALLLLLDASGSVRTEVNDIRLAALSLLAEIGPRDQVVVMRFNDRVEFTQDWPADKLQLQRALLQMPATGNTKFFNALYDAALKLRERKLDPVTPCDSRCDFTTPR